MSERGEPIGHPKSVCGVADGYEERRAFRKVGGPDDRQIANFTTSGAVVDEASNLDHRRDGDVQGLPSHTAGADNPECHVSMVVARKRDLGDGQRHRRLCA